MNQERFYTVEVVTPVIDSKPRYRVAIYIGETLLFTSLHPDEASRDEQCKRWEERGYERRYSLLREQT